MAERLIIAISGASGAIFGIRALEVLKAVPGVETHLIVSPSAQITIAEETDWALADVKALADVVYSHKDIGAALSSGSYQTLGMLVAPCSIKTLSGIAHCYDENLIIRAADVCLKERRRVVAMLRETPFHLGHIKVMELATQSGVIVMPPVPAFYHRPETIDDIINQTLGRALDLFDLADKGIDPGLVERWKGG